VCVFWSHIDNTSQSSHITQPSRHTLVALRKYRRVSTSSVPESPFQKMGESYREMFISVQLQNSLAPIPACDVAGDSEKQGSVCQCAQPSAPPPHLCATQATSCAHRREPHPPAAPRAPRRDPSNPRRDPRGTNTPPPATVPPGTPPAHPPRTPPPGSPPPPPISCTRHRPRAASSPPHPRLRQGRRRGDDNERPRGVARPGLPAAQTPTGETPRPLAGSRDLSASLHWGTDSSAPCRRRRRRAARGMGLHSFTVQFNS
jgi:hypothetical protein